MSIQFTLGKRLLRAAVSLGFLVGLIAAENGAGQAATSESIVTSKTATDVSVPVLPGFCASSNGSDCLFSAQAEIGLFDEFGVALEDDDSLEMLRADIQKRTFGIDQVLFGLRIASKAAQSTRTNISPPLLV